MDILSQTELGVHKHIFLELVDELQLMGYSDARDVKLEEKLAIFLSQLESAYAKLARLSLNLKTLHGKISKVCKAVTHSKGQKEHAIAAMKKILNQ